MNGQRSLVVDANILLRAVFGNRVRSLLDKPDSAVAFQSPAMCFDEARRYVPAIAARRRVDPISALEVLDEICTVVEAIDPEHYAHFEVAARQRIASRDLNDWPIVATALLLDCPPWTEDRDFFGCGIATWITGTVEIFLRNE